ncbi:MAG: FAD-dependent oxidoreductase [Planctomycetota bacterium]|nr:FAD-dependent oxidoreductase [Planctomycetota bacterium]
MNPISRRELLSTFLGAPTALAAMSSGCSSSYSFPTGQFVGPSFEIGHKLRDGFRPRPTEDAWRNVDTVIVGGGIAGLSAAWRLRSQGYDDFVVLELEEAPGGTSRSDQSNLPGQTTPCGYPWGAHYVPTPMSNNTDFIALLAEMKALAEPPVDDAGEPVIAEQFLCRDPEERVFANGQWHEGLYLMDGADDDDLAQLKAFEREIDRWADWRDAAGRRAFALPMAMGSDDEEVTKLDLITMSEWLQRQHFTSERLKWVVDYACRDDYGGTAEQISAWAGLFYFAARRRKSGAESQPLIAWPEGNGRIVDHFRASAHDNLQLGMAVTEITRRDRAAARHAVEVVAVDRDERVHGWKASHVIFAAPQFLAPVLIRDFPEDRTRAAKAFEYGSWMVSNLWLKDRPVEDNGFSLAWDNVIHDSRSLGYVVATHQKGVDWGASIWTHYYPLCDDSPQSVRNRMLKLDWSEWVEVVLSDIEVAHPDLRSLVERVDVMRWGHAMVRPRPGFVWSRNRREAAQPLDTIHFAHTDLSGVALFEEAFHHGVRAADEIIC